MQATEVAHQSSVRSFLFGHQRFFIRRIDIRLEIMETPLDFTKFHTSLCFVLLSVFGWYLMDDPPQALPVGGFQAIRMTVFSESW